MNKAFQLARWLWWLSLATLPIAISSLKQSYRSHIGCPPAGDCYVAGWTLLMEWNILIILAALLMWPVCFYYVVLAPLSALTRRGKGPNNSFKP